MDISIESLMPFEELRSDAERVFSLVDKIGTVVLLKDDMPAYIIVKYDVAKTVDSCAFPGQLTNHTLQEAMKIVLVDAPEKTLHAAKLADEIFNRRLYLQKNGEKARYTQVRARCGHYPGIFEPLPKNFIRLRESGE